MPMISLISEYFKCGCVNVDRSGVYTHTQPTPPEYFLNTVQANVPTDLFSPLITQMHTHISNMTDHETVNLVGDKKITEQSCMLLSKSNTLFSCSESSDPSPPSPSPRSRTPLGLLTPNSRYFFIFVILTSLFGWFSSTVRLFVFGHFLLVFCWSIVVLVTSKCRRSGSNSGGTRTPQEERELEKVTTLAFIKKLIVTRQCNMGVI